MNCNCCKNETRSIQYKDEFLNNQIQYCTYCGHLQIKEIPSQDEIRFYYSKKYSEKRGETVSEPYFRIMQKRAAAQVHFISQNINLSEKSIIDLGCGYGFFLSELRSKASLLKGYEYDTKCIDFCKKRELNVKLLNSESDIKLIEICDVVVLSHVLEHFLDVSYVLSILREKTKYIFIEVPNYDVNLSEQFEDQEGHINFFTNRSLEQLLNQLGFKIIQLNSYGPNMNLFWKKNKRQLKTILSKFSNDYFMNKYNKQTKNGIWIRALISCDNV
jgi:2-polyprenyl-3-methyl-5-hydroxy-6-metoxy-1,4-benzoquinol methylase